MQNFSYKPLSQAKLPKQKKMKGQEVNEMPLYCRYICLRVNSNEMENKCILGIEMVWITYIEIKDIEVMLSVKHDR